MADEHYRMVYRSARPGRTAVLMLAGAGSWEGIAAGVLGSLSLTWGGRGDIVIPVTETGPHPAFRPVVKAFDPDWISTYQITSPDVALEDDDGGWLIEVPGDDAAAVAGWCSPFPAEHGFYPWSSHGRAVHRPLIPAAVFPQAWTPQVVDLDLSSIDPLLALMVTMCTGTLAGAEDLPGGCAPQLLAASEKDLPALSELALVGAAETQPSPADSDVRHMRGLHAALPVPDISGISPVQPLERTGHGMARLQHVAARPQPWVVVIGDACEDFCFALACDRLLGGATWLPFPRLSDQVLDAAFHTLALHITTSSTMHGMPVPITSVSLDTAAVTQAREQLRDRGGTAFTDARTVIVASEAISFDHPARLGDPAHLHLAETSPVHRDPEDGSLCVDTALVTPVPDVARTAAPGEVAWEVDVRVEGEQPPARQALGPDALLAVISGTENLEIRTGAEGLTYHSHSALVTFAGGTLEMPLARPRLSLPSAGEVISRLADAAGYTIRPSQTGRLNTTVVELWGGIPQAAADFGGPVWPLLSALTPAVGEKDGNKGGRLVVNGLPYVTFRQAADLMRIAGAKTREELDRLLRRRILRRGLVLRCGRCNWLGWYPLGSLGQAFECPRCTHSNIIEQQLWRDPFEEPAWYYDLDHAVREALRLNGRIPILAASKLREKYTDAFSFTLDFEMIKAGAAKPIVEIDLAVTGNGKVILCEAKASDVLAAAARDEQRDASKLIKACQALTADALCLATGKSSWSARTRTSIQAGCDGAGVTALWLEQLGL